MKMDEEQLLSLLQSKEDDAGAYAWGTLSTDRTKAKQEYFRQPYGNEEEGWASIVASDTQDTVEWILAALLKVFTSTDKAVVFEPTKAEDVKGAEQATDACNYVFYKQNPGFLVLYTAFKDALMLRNSATMWRKETQEVVSTQPFKGATPEMLAMLLQDDDVEIQEANQEPMIDPQTGQPVIGMDGLPVMLVSGRLKKVESKTIVKVESFNPDDLLIDDTWSTPLLQDCPYVCRMMNVTLTDLKMMGIKDVTAEELRASDTSSTTLRIDQDTISSTLGEQDNNDSDDSMATGWLRMEWVLVDADGDGIAERLCIYRLKDKILKREVVSHVPIATWSPLINTHQWDGMSMADVVSDLQLLHTELLRQTLNNLYLTNTPRTKVLTDANWSPLANIDDLLDSRIGGVIRMRDPNAIQEQVTPFAGAASMPMLEYVQGMRENRTGVSRTSMGLNPDSLNNTATGRQIDQSAANQRIELIARIAAECMLKPVFQGILKLLTEGGMEKLAFRLRDEFVEYDPNEWRDQYDMTINVGLGTGDKSQQGAQLMAIYQMQQAGMAMGLATPKHVYNTMARMVENAGYKDVQNFIQDPANAPPMPPQTPLPVQIEQMKTQAEAQKFQAQQQADIQRFQAETQMAKEVETVKAQAKQMEIEANLRLQAANDQRDSERELMKAQYDAQLAQQKLEFDRWKVEFEAQNKIYIEEMKLRGAPMSDVVQHKDDMLQVLTGLQAVIQEMGAPKVIVRDANGKAIGVQKFNGVQ